MKSSTIQSDNTSPAANPLCELRESLKGFADRCLSQRWFGPLFRVHVAQDIVADVEKNEQAAKAVVYGEEQRNLLNAQELDEIRADGVVSPDEFARLGRLASRERRSAAALHGVTEVLA